MERAGRTVFVVSLSPTVLLDLFAQDLFADARHFHLVLMEDVFDDCVQACGKTESAMRSGGRVRRLSLWRGWGAHSGPDRA